MIDSCLSRHLCPYDLLIYVIARLYDDGREAENSLHIVHEGYDADWHTVGVWTLYLEYTPILMHMQSSVPRL